MKCGHLFNGIGGFALAAHWMGWQNIMHCEIDPFCNKIMNYHFPNSFQHEDIRTTDFTIWRNRIDLLTGGWPCQPVSTAGKRKGKDDVRYLWPENIRAIREIQPRIVVGENVRGLTNWQGGILFDEVQADLETEGYEVLPFLLPAAGVNAPHRRDRIWFVAHANSDGGQRDKKFKNRYEHITGGASFGELNPYVSSGATSDAGCIFSNRREIDESEQRVNNWQNCGREEAANKSERLCSKTDWANFPTQFPVCGRNDGLPSGLVDYPVPSKSGTRILKGKQAYGRWRKESLKALGNAVVPQVVYQIFKAIEQWQLGQE